MFLIAILLQNFSGHIFQIWNKSVLYRYTIPRSVLADVRGGGATRHVPPSCKILVKYVCNRAMPPPLFTLYAPPHINLIWMQHRICIFQTRVFVLFIEHCISVQKVKVSLNINRSLEYTFVYLCCFLKLFCLKDKQILFYVNFFFWCIKNNFF